MNDKRRPKLSRDELRALLLRTGRTLLQEEGLGSRAETLTFKRAFDRVEADRGIRLSHASVIRRVWENLDDYQTEALARVAAEDGIGDFEATFTALVPLFESLDLSSPEARRISMREVCRVGGSTNVVTLLESTDWTLWIGVWALANSGNFRGEEARRHQRIQESLLDGYQRLTSLWEGVYEGMAKLFGVRARSPLTIRQFTMAVGALAEGCSLRQRLDSRMEGIVRPSGPNEEDQEWTIFAIGMEALQARFFEPDPGREGRTDRPET